ncbi:hypothetical protein [Polaromonas glacialis]|uniref:hypothetical protein n=1 Tax=Polaromonas glacialis TaxID=866564 RepID=UPI0012EC31AB|nr:hypothetical protein [Polaromonas glacialis]
MKKLIFTAAAMLLVSGCAFNVTLMPRDSGKFYTGEMAGPGNGTGTMTIKMEGDDVCTGPVARVASNESFGFANTYLANSKGKVSSALTTVATSGDVTIKAILSCTSGKGLRCEMTGQGGGGGICVDDSGRIFDALAIRK